MKALIQIYLKNTGLVIGAFVLLLAGLPSIGEAGERPQLNILSADADVDQGILALQGEYFIWANDSGTTVTIDSQDLSVTSLSETEIEALLPAFLEPGSYLVTVARGAGSVHNDEMLVNVGKVESLRTVDLHHYQDPPEHLWDAASLSLLFGADELPVVSYYMECCGDFNHPVRFFAKCLDSKCEQVCYRSAEYGVHVDLEPLFSNRVTARIGDELFLFLGTEFSDVPVHSQLRLAYNVNYYGPNSPGENCSEIETLTTWHTNLIDELDASYIFSDESIQLDPLGFPAILYTVGELSPDSLGDWELRLAVCSDPNCTTPPNVELIDSTPPWPDPWNNPYSQPVMTMGSDGYPLVVFSSADGSGGWETGVVKCNDPLCSTRSTTTIVGDAWSHDDIAIGSDGFPVIAGRRQFTPTQGEIRVTHCDSADCSASTSSVLAAAPDYRSPVSIDILGNDLPVIAYIDSGNRVVLAECLNLECSEAELNVLDWVTAEDLFMRVDAQGMVGIANQETIAAWSSDSFKLTRYLRIGLR